MPVLIRCWCLFVVVSLAARCAAAEGDADLHDFLTQARAVGISVAPLPVDPATQAWWEGGKSALTDILTMNAWEVAKHPEYLAQHGVPGSDGPQDVWNRWPGGPVHLGKGDELYSYLGRQTVLCDAYLLVADSSELPHLLALRRAFIAGIERFDCSSASDMEWGANDRLADASQCIAGYLGARRNPIRLADGVAVAHELAALAALLEARLHSGIVSEIRSAYPAVTTEIDRAFQLENVPVSQVPARRTQIMNVRSRFLLNLLEWHRQISSARDLFELAHRAVALHRATRRAKCDLRSTMCDHSDYGIMRMIESILALRLLAAQLTDQPWPNDPFAAAPRTPLQCRVRGPGVITEVWTVGSRMWPETGWIQIDGSHPLTWGAVARVPNARVDKPGEPGP